MAIDSIGIMYKKYLIAGIMLTSVLAIGQHFAIQTREVQAQQSGGFFENLGKDIDDAGRQYSNGVADGKLAGVSGDSKNCPSNDTAYCVGWTTGYDIGERSANVVQEAQSRDDGEFVPMDNN